jgi:sugar-specific transcriptional regulator TrmB
MNGPEHGGLTASEIVDVIGHPYSGHGCYDRCFDDLKALEREGYVERLPGRPAHWEPVTHPLTVLGTRHG